MGEFSSDDHFIYYCGQEFLRRNGVALIVNKRAQNAELECNLKNNNMISVRFQDKPINVTVIQLWKEVCNMVQKEVIKTAPKKKKCKRQNGCLRRLSNS